MDVAEQYLHGAVGHIVEELAVVRYQKQTAAPSLQIILKPLDGFYVKVVGRLVKHQKVGLPEQNLRKFYAHIPALAEGTGLTAQLVVLETESEESLARLHLRRLAVGYGKAVVELGEALDYRRVFR